MAVHNLPANAHTIHVGVIDRSFPPVLTIDDGDEVLVETWAHWANAVKPGMSFDDVGAVRQRHVEKNGNVGPHSVTGPIYVRGAAPGSALRIDIVDLRLGDYGFNLILPRARTRGILADDFEGGEIRHFQLDAKRMTTDFGSGITLQLRPFLGIMGVAPAASGPHSSSAPGPFGGNMDCPEFVVGTTLFLPIFADGALFYVGDAHAIQGCGEVDQTAIETSMKEAHLRVTVVKDRPLERPYGETPDTLISMGFDEDLLVAARIAVRDMVHLLSRGFELDPADAYTLCSLKGDLLITQLVNGVKGVHMRFPKNVLISRSR